jgi:hypothetical protein
MLALLLNPTVISILGAAVLFILRQVFKDRADKAETNFQTGVRLAYNIVNEISALTPNTVDDKVALGLKYLNDYVNAGGGKVSVADEARAKLLFKAMHGEEKAANGQVQ